MSKKQAYFWFGLFAFGTVMFTLVQDKLRPAYNGQNMLIKYLLGTAPNFFAGLGLASFFFVMLHHYNSTSKNPSTSVWLNERLNLTSIFITILGLFTWEFIQIYSNHGHFDWHDLLWTIVGVSIFYLVYTCIKPKLNFK